ncbi:SH2 domain-containing protein 1A-like isoform X1 [Xiphophorus maculatus]|uniref:SH2 domain-containing protein 1A-like n=2 Tax=Xiphophorus maculatus TaxID=8083 RepID=A0A3B5R9L6_XIPMA|nr:SH2 domain-containing protein 1A-like isoform X1 [Xiphophorus maculatus]
MQQSAFTSNCRERSRWAPGSEGAMETEGAAVRSIYYGRIGSKVTEKLLERFGCDGSFLLRDSETVPGAYCLCVRKAPFVHTYRLERDGDGWYLQDLRGRLLKFGTVESLIDHYRSHPTSHQGVAPLTLPLDRATVPSNWIQGLVYMEMNCGGQSGQ